MSQCHVSTAGGRTGGLNCAQATLLGVPAAQQAPAESQGPSASSQSKPIVEQRVVEQPVVVPAAQQAPAASQGPSASSQSKPIVEQPVVEQPVVVPAAQQALAASQGPSASSQSKPIVEQFVVEQPIVVPAAQQAPAASQGPSASSQSKPIVEQLVVEQPVVEQQQLIVEQPRHDARGTAVEPPATTLPAQQPSSAVTPLDDSVTQVEKKARTLTPTASSAPQSQSLVARIAHEVTIDTESDDDDALALAASQGRTGGKLDPAGVATSKLIRRSGDLYDTLHVVPAEMPDEIWEVLERRRSRCRQEGIGEEDPLPPWIVDQVVAAIKRDWRQVPEQLQRVQMLQERGDASMDLIGRTMQSWFRTWAYERFGGLSWLWWFSFVMGVGNDAALFHMILLRIWALRAKLTIQVSDKVCPCSCLVVVWLLLIVLSPGSCHALAMLLPCSCQLLPCSCHALAMLLSCSCCVALVVLCCVVYRLCFR